MVEGVSQDYKKAFEWYIKAAKQVFDAQNNLGALYANGHGVAEDEKQAEWYNKSC